MVELNFITFLQPDKQVKYSLEYYMYVYIFIKEIYYLLFLKTIICSKIVFINFFFIFLSNYVFYFIIVELENHLEKVTQERNELLVMYCIVVFMYIDIIFTI